MISFTHSEQNIGAPPFVGITEDDEQHLKGSQHSCTFDHRGYMFFGKAGFTTSWTTRPANFDCQWKTPGGNEIGFK